MTHDQLKAVGDAWAEAAGKDIDIVIAGVNAACVLRRAKLHRERTVDAMAFTHRASTFFGDSVVRQRLIAAGVLS